MNKENHNTEYKRIWKDEYLKWVCGFANARGGKIYVGIDNDMSVVGVAHLHQQLEDIPNKIVTMLGIVPMVRQIEQDNKDILEIDIEPSNIPISYKGVFYIRSGATNQELRGVALQQFLMKKFGKNWEDMPCYGATIDDIDPEAVRYFLKKGIKEGRLSHETENSSLEEVISNLGLIDDGVPCNGAILLFGKCPQRHFVTSSFKIGRFGTANFDLMSQEIVDGNLIQMPDRVMRTLNDKYLIRPIHYEGIQRVEPLELPEEALREIICNAIVHRDYQGTWSQMSIYGDHIRLWNEGNLPDDLPIEKLMGKHTSKPRNPKMAEAFYRAGLIEAWGRGIEKIVNGFKAEGLTPPVFSIEQGGFTVNIPREIFKAVSLGENARVGQYKDEPNQNRTKTEPERAEPNQNEPNRNEPNQNKTEQKDKILELLTANPMITRNELAIILNIHVSSVQRRIGSLVKEGRIRRVGFNKGGSWEIIKADSVKAASNL